MKRKITISLISLIVAFIVLVPVLTGCSMSKLALNLAQRGFYGMNFRHNLKSQKEFNFKNMPCRPFKGNTGNKQKYNQNAANTPFIGIKMAAAPTGTTGVLVVNTIAGSPAEAAGLKPQDIISALDGKAVTNPQDLLQQVLTHKVGDIIKLTISRNGQSQDLNITLAGWPVTNNNFQKWQNDQGKQKNLQNSGTQDQQTNQNKTY